LQDVRVRVDKAPPLHAPIYWLQWETIGWRR